jgi:hypothetical protein
MPVTDNDKQNYRQQKSVHDRGILHHRSHFTHGSHVCRVGRLHHFHAVLLAADIEALATLNQETDQNLSKEIKALNLNLKVVD